jgi:hypothetical protein
MSISRKSHYKNLTTSEQLTKARLEGLGLFVYPCTAIMPFNPGIPDFWVCYEKRSFFGNQIGFGCMRQKSYDGRRRRQNVTPDKGFFLEVKGCYPMCLARKAFQGNQRRKFASLIRMGFTVLIYFQDGVLNFDKFVASNRN